LKVKKGRSKRRKLLLMGSSAIKARELPAEIRGRIDEAIAGKLKIIGEAPGGVQALPRLSEV